MPRTMAVAPTAAVDTKTLAVVAFLKVLMTNPTAASPARKARLSLASDPWIDDLTDQKDETQSNRSDKAIRAQ